MSPSTMHKLQGGSGGLLTDKVAAVVLRVRRATVVVVDAARRAAAIARVTDVRRASAAMMIQSHSCGLLKARTQTGTQARRHKQQQQSHTRANQNVHRSRLSNHVKRSLQDCVWCFVSTQFLAMSLFCCCFAYAPTNPAGLPSFKGLVQVQVQVLTGVQLH